jgi:peptide-methionine (S)-S-oxide reductase
LLGIVAASLYAVPPPERASAIFAGGCFWCEETAYEGVPGVISVTSGYIGGQKKNPTYDEVSSGGTGHAEAVEVVFDPARTSYEKLLDIFWRNVDPFQKDAQFCDHGSQYRSGIFYRGDEQMKAAFESLRKLEGEPRFKGKIVTEIVPATKFYRAEEYHQDFYKKNPIRYKTYRMGCGRDARLKEIWGAPAGGHK